MIWIVIGLYAVGALLPLAGLAGLYRKAKRTAAPLKGWPPNSYGAVQAAVPGILADAASKPVTAGLDFLFIGGGVVLSAAASITSLFLP